MTRKRDIITCAGSLAFLAAMPFGPRIVFAPDDGNGQSGGGGGGDDGGYGLDPSPAQPGDGDGQSGQQGQPGGAPSNAGNPSEPIGGADGAQPSLHKPEGVPDHLFGQNDQETIDKIWNAYKGAREALGKQSKAPDKPEAYQPFAWSDKVKANLSIAEDDEAATLFRSIAHKHGMNDENMKAVPEFFEALIEKGVIEPPHDTRAEMRALAPQGFAGSDEAKEAKGAERVAAADRWIAQLSSQRGFDDGMKTEMRLLTTTAAGVKVIESFMTSGMGGSVNPGGQTGGEPTITKAVLDARIADPRNDIMGDKYDPAFAQETDAMFKKFYPD
ncbi:hypothetical protein [Jiella avicenniae]|uniref:Uncharacterized protein n=1 Tax=Jiella avicenniae TaxID=2907202 RepID=A0A9X1NVR0_9HYPH|nr:hypothetical protein [Jiella avicenniae]MCE7026422.1 hypothetical protein [Jiella avicenniae]